MNSKTLRGIYINSTGEKPELTQYSMWLEMTSISELETLKKTVDELKRQVLVLREKVTQYENELLEETV